MPYELCFLPRVTPDLALAYEAHAMAARRPTTLFLLWSCHDAVIVGRHQSIPAEVDLAYLKQEGIGLYRRRSGGGTVYCDAGNLNLSVIAPRARAAEDWARLDALLLTTLRELGCEAALGPCGDILVAEQKVSGAASWHRGGHVLQHRTLLLDSDLARLERVLSPRLATRSEAPRSRPSATRNILPRGLAAEPYMHLLARRLSEAFGAQAWSPPPVQTSALAELQAQYAGSAWIWARDPAARVQLTVEGSAAAPLELELQGGRISASHASCDVGRWLGQQLVGRTLSEALDWSYSPAPRLRFGRSA